MDFWNKLISKFTTTENKNKINNKYYYAIMQYERYIVYGVLALVLFGVLDGPINFLSDILFGLIYKIASLPFGG